MPKRKKSQAVSNKRKKAGKSPVAPQAPPAADLINGLNDDCLLRIFDYLAISDRLQVETVCKRWRRVFKLAWQDLKTLDFTSCNQENTDLYKFPPKLRTNQGVGRILKKLGRDVHQLKLGYPCRFNILPIVGQYCTNLTRLEIDFGGKSYDKSFAKFFPRMQKLKYFEICNIKCYPRQVFQILPSDTLTEIHLGCHSRRFSPYFLQRGSVPLIAPTAIENFTKLTAISLNGFHLKANMIDVISKKLNLKYLSLDSSICKRLPYLHCLTKLEHLNLSANYLVNDRVLMDISEYCINLKYLNIRVCGKVTDQGIRTLGKLPQLEELELTDISTITGTCLWTLNSLKRINCSACDNIHDDAITKLVKNVINLEYLNIVYSAVTINVLDVANEISKLRITPLHIVVSQSVKDAWNEPDVSPLLVIRDDELYDDWDG